MVGLGAATYLCTTRQRMQAGRQESACQAFLSQEDKGQAGRKGRDWSFSELLATWQAARRGNQKLVAAISLDGHLADRGTQGSADGRLVGQGPQGAAQFHTDFRKVYAAILDNWLGVSSKTVLGSEFKPAGIFKS